MFGLHFLLIVYMDEYTDASHRGRWHSPLTLRQSGGYVYTLTLASVMVANVASVTVLGVGEGRAVWPSMFWDPF